MFCDIEDGLVLVKIITQLEASNTREEINTAAELFWMLALEVEDGDLD